MFAEVVYMTCNDGMYMPLEFAFANHPANVKLFRIAPVPDYYWTTMRDRINTKSRFNNTDRFYNSKVTDFAKTSYEWLEWKLDANLWLTQLHYYIPPDTPLIVRGASQYHFFKNICGYMNVKKIVWGTGSSVVNISHPHDTKLYQYPCPGIEVATMALHLNGQ